MKKHFDDIFIKNYPTLDLHGYDRFTASVAANDFVLENHKLKNNKIIIIHGIGQGTIKKSVHDTLKTNKFILDYRLHGFNLGMTIITLKLEGE